MSERRRACRIYTPSVHCRGDSGSFQSICRPAHPRVAYRIRTNALTRRRSNSESRLQERGEEQDKDQSRSEACLLLQHCKQHITILAHSQACLPGQHLWLRDGNCTERWSLSRSLQGRGQLPLRGRDFQPSWERCQLRADPATRGLGGQQRSSAADVRGDGLGGMTTWLDDSLS